MFWPKFNRWVVSPVVQAALAHAQFEAVHPFIDGNGRTGRALIHLVLRRRGSAANFVPPISLVMATRSKSYIQGLSAVRAVDSEAGDGGREGVNERVSFFAGACLTACEEAAAFEERARRLRRSWRERLGPARKNSALDLLIDELVGMPLFTVGAASEATARAFSAVSAAVERCVEAGVVRPVKAQGRNRVFEVPEVIDEFNMFERKLASPVGDAGIEKPSRVVPDNLARWR